MIMYRKHIKRVIDIIFSTVALVVLSPLLIILALLIVLNMGAPVLFKQERIGKDEKIFIMYKFRSMNSKKDSEGNLLPDSQRVTMFGKILRGSSLDELPELINILKGDISIIGPRPLLVDYLPYYTDFERQRHKIRGGLTVPEVLYDNLTPTWEEQFKYEIDYINNISFLLDLKIVIKTVSGVFKRGSHGYGSYVRRSLIEEREGRENA